MSGFRIADAWRRLLMGVRLSQHNKLLCTRTSKNGTSKANGETPSVRDLDVYQQLKNLDFKTATKILLTTPPKRKTFGIDFHLVQLFFACMPSLAVYLVAQYARSEIRKMEAEEELKKKQAEVEEKAKEIEASALEEMMELGADSELLNVKVRLDTLEETVKQIAFETKKLSSGNLTMDQDSTKRKQTFSPNPASKPEERSSAPDNSHSNLKSDALKPSVSHETVRSSAPPTDTQSVQGQKADNGEAIQSTKKR